MTRPEPAPSVQARTRVLSIHADYRCGKTGVCCSSGWDIPVEPATEDALREALRSGALRRPAEEPFRAVRGLPHGARVVLGAGSGSRCAFLETHTGISSCGVHRQLGPGALASACRDFPRVVTLTPAGFSITLSHCCPTAAGLLFRGEPRLGIEEDPPAFPPDWPYEGLDARDSVGPLLRPGVLLGWEAHARWEAHAVETLARDDLDSSRAVALLAARAEAARRWTPRQGPFDAHLERCLAETEIPSAGAGLDGQTCTEAWRLVAGCVPRGHPLPSPPDPHPREERVAADAAHRFGPHDAPVRRWLAARAFASWLALQGEGLRTTVLGLRLALEVLGAEVERGRGPGEPSPPLDETALLEAFRRADLLLVHLADPTALARRLARSEVASGPATPSW